MEDNDSMYEPKFSSADEELLHASRNGHVTRIQEVLDKWQQGNGEFSLDINCKGKQKSNRGWTPLHLGAYFGHLDVVQLLLENGADVNIVNSVGDTPLHRAAHTGREAVVTILLQYGADVSLVNSEGLLPRNVARTGEIIRLIEATENHESRKQEEELLEAASQGKIDTISRLLKKSNPPNVNCTDRFGNTALHIAALRGQKEVSVFLLQNGINTNIKNKNDQLASDMTQSQQMKQLLGLQPVKSLQLQPQRCEGLLLKKSRILGFRPVWVILDRGVLSYFENRGDASTGTKRKGVKYLDEAKVSVPIVPSLDMKIAFSDGTTHTLSADPVNGAHVTKQKWINALKEHIGYSTHYIHWGKLPSEYDEDIIPLGTMQDALKTSQAHQKLLEKQVHTLSAMIKEPKSKAANKNNQNLSSDDGQLQNIQAEIETLLQSSRDMCCSLAHCMTLFSQQEEIRQLQLKEEMEKCRVLQEALHALATEHHELERSISSRSRKSSMRYYDTDDDEFYECDEDGEGSPGGYESIADTFGDALSVDLDSQSAKPTTKPWGSVYEAK